MSSQQGSQHAKGKGRGKTSKKGKNQPQEETEINSNQIEVSFLDPTVKIPTSLRREDFAGCPLERFKDFSVEWQQKIVENYGNTLRSIAGKDKVLELTNQRRKELFLRCVNKAKGAMKQQRKTAEKTEEEDEKKVEEVDTPSTVPTPPALGISVSDAIRAAAQSSSITLPTTKIKLEQTAAMLFHTMTHELQETALLECDEAARKVLLSGSTIENPVQFFLPILHQLSRSQQAGSDGSNSANNYGKTASKPTTSDNISSDNSSNLQPDSQTATLAATPSSADAKLQNVSDAPVTLPKTKFQLEESAAIIFHCMDLDFQEKALAKCDEEALKVIQRGVPIHKPVEFFTNVLKKLLLQNRDGISKSSPVKSSPKADSQTSTSNPKKLVLLSKENSPNRPAKSQPQQQQSKKATAKPATAQPKDGVQILQKGSTPSKQKGPPRATTANNATTVPSNNHQTERAIAALTAELEDRTRQWRDLQTKNQDLTKLWEVEQKRVAAFQERIATLERVNQQLKEQLVQKEDYIAEKVKEVEKRSVQEQTDYKAMVNTVTTLSKELCTAQQEKRELEQAVESEKLWGQEKDSEIQRLKAELKRSEMLRPTPRNTVPESQQIEALKRQLQKTQEKLAKVTKGQNKLKSKESADSKRKNRAKPSLADFVLGEQEPGSVQILRQRSASTGEGNPPPAASASESFDIEGEGILEFDLSNEAGLSACLQAPPPEPENAGINFHGIEQGYDEGGNGDGSSSHSDEDGHEEYYDETAEFDFLLASFGEDEIRIDSEDTPKRVTRTLHLEFDRNREVVDVHLILTLPEGYPTTNTPIDVEASFAPETNPSIEARKVSMDALPDLIKVCRWEAQGSVGSREAIFSTLQTADQWLQNEWHGVQAKRLPSDETGKACVSNGANQVISIARMLLSIHHLVDAERIGYVKQTAGHYNLGGYLKLGYPGYVLVEGLEDNCSFFLEALVQQQNKIRTGKRTKAKVDSAYFSVAGKVAIQIEDLDGERLLPKKLIEIEKSKEGMECFAEFCQRVDLAKYLV